ncbi:MULTISPECIES: LysR family transcriptional regulator [unclassified Pseudomonas]|uniref:LysR family transcriptional regulator n=1 Tax=unclassified Pseudomonas TaxID=196821 RepID=UPI000BC8851D|nr:MULTISPECIES: LysR family transcriptional regulator [unclassified Pseudomonas]PVZ20125.1 DNA-binding transcriptional LysR family regulator [Pseudomonas sp. URIL14HWK12:I12]PVZ27191.1 DNA-binding transcriptional LysR family regulator [Pseudomonas sp. URIL14HWK12:I10]PVZ38080.1 DNA-binding transcriptional LysR family regulator [Pseudomonas sp. URIL14HWK12:I11]SNZ04620.1 DNA-binding transcriptional regulator, LysR family [Pseudomonas sp. URIL14HWK12:I9]
MPADFNLLSVFERVAQLGSFRAAADQLGVTRSAVSQSVRRLEDSLGVALLLRSTRNVRPSEAGERLLRQIREPLAALAGALDDAADHGPPQGLLRLAVTSIAEDFLEGQLVASFAEAYPRITLDVTVTDEVFDIVERGFDAGVRLGEVIEQDMVAVPLTGPQREAAVATPAYLARHGRPGHPRELVNHRCIGWRPSPDTAPWRWEFSEQGQAFAVAVEPQITTNDMWLMLRTALAGGGITFGIEATFAPWLRSGELEAVLQEYLPPFPGFYLYYPSRHNMPAKLRALIEHVRRFRETRDLAGPSRSRL